MQNKDEKAPNWELQEVRIENMEDDQLAMSAKEMKGQYFDNEYFKASTIEHNQESSINGNSEN